MQLLLMVLFYLAGQFNAQGYLFSALQFFLSLAVQGQWQTILMLVFMLCCFKFGDRAVFKILSSALGALSVMYSLTL